MKWLPLRCGYISERSEGPAEVLHRRYVTSPSLCLSSPCLTAVHTTRATHKKGARTKPRSRSKDRSAHPGDAGTSERGYYSKGEEGIRATVRDMGRTLGGSG